MVGPDADAKGKTLRKGERRSNDLRFDEWLARRQSNADVTFYDFMLELNSNEGNAQKPLFIADMASGLRHPHPQRSREESAVLSPTNAAQPRDTYLKLKARYDTLPGTDGMLEKNLEIYDAQLLADARALRAQHRAAPHQLLRPHYRGLLEAYEAEFVMRTGMRDDKIIEFFDNYVHDSLAGFARDCTLPSDPRVIYIGDDMKSDHAHAAPRPTRRMSVAA